MKAAAGEASKDAGLLHEPLLLAAVLLFPTKRWIMNVTPRARPVYLQAMPGLD